MMTINKFIFCVKICVVVSINLLPKRKLCLYLAFGDARGYPIERDIYLTALKELQCGERIDTSKVVLRSASPTAVPTKKNSLKNRSKSLAVGRPMGPPGFAMSRRNFANGGPFSPQRFAGPPPGFGPMPPPLMPPIPPPMGPPLYGPRPFRYGPPPMRPAMPPTPPGPGFPHPGFPPRMPGLPRMAGPPRLPVGPAARLPPPKMPPPPPPPPLPSRTAKQLQGQKKKQQIRNGIMERAINIRLRRNGPVSRIMPKAHKEQDFTVDTFEENLLTTSIVTQSRRQTKGRFNQTK